MWEKNGEEIGKKSRQLIFSREKLNSGKIGLSKEEIAVEKSK